LDVRASGVPASERQGRTEMRKVLVGLHDARRAAWRRAGMNSYPMWRRLGWLSIPASGRGAPTGRTRQRKTVVTLHRVRQRRLFRPLALKSRLQRSPGYCRRNTLSCVRVPNPSRDRGSPAAISPSSVFPSLRRSVFYLVASPVALFFLAAAPCFFFDCACFATLICFLSPPYDTSAWAEIPLALVGDIVAY